MSFAPVFEAFLVLLLGTPTYDCCSAKIVSKIGALDTNTRLQKLVSGSLAMFHMYVSYRCCPFVSRMSGGGVNGNISSWPMKNTLVLAFSTLAIYSAYSGIQKAQNDIIQPKGLGVASVACLHAFLFMSSILSPLYIHFVGLKVSFLLAFICHCLYTLSNFYVDWWSLIPSSILLGLTVSPMLVAKHLYINTMGQFGSALDKIDSHSSISKYNGVFSGLAHLSLVIGNFISSVFLYQSSKDQSDVNSNGIHGADDCFGDVNKSPMIVQPDAYNSLLGIYLTFGLVGLVTTFCRLRPLDTDRKNRNSLEKSLWMCCSAFNDKNVLLFIPICVSQTVNFYILHTDFTKAFVNYTVGVKMVGYVMMVYGITSAIFSVIFGIVVRYTGRQPLMGIAMIADFITLLLMLLWKPQPDRMAVLLFIIPCARALVTGITSSQLPAMVATAFPDKQAAVFSNIETWRLAYIFIFGTEQIICLKTKLYLALTLLAVSTLCYILLECRLMLEQRKKEPVDYFFVNEDDLENDSDDLQSRLLISHVDSSAPF